MMRRLKRLAISAALALVLTFVAPPLAHQVNISFSISEASASPSTKRKLKRQRYASARGLVVASARRHRVPQWLALKVGNMESGLQCGRVGDQGRSHGPLQIQIRTARALFGVRNVARLSCAAQTDYGMRHLAMELRRSGGNPWLAAKRHNAGLGASAKSRWGRDYANAVVGGGKKKKLRKNRRRA